MLWEKETYKYWGILELDIIKQVEMKEKSVSQMNKETSQNQTLQLESHQRNKHRGCPPCKIFGTILKNGPEDKKTNDDAIGLTFER